MVEDKLSSFKAVGRPGRGIRWSDLEKMVSYGHNDNHAQRHGEAIDEVDGLGHCGVGKGNNFPESKVQETFTWAHAARN